MPTATTRNRVKLLLTLRRYEAGALPVPTKWRSWRRGSVRSTYARDPLRACARRSARARRGAGRSSIPSCSGSRSSSSASSSPSRSGSAGTAATSATRSTRARQPLRRGPRRRAARPARPRRAHGRPRAARGRPAVPHGARPLGLGLMTILGESQGGATGEALDLIFGRLLGETGTQVLGFFSLVTGALLVSGASLGALLSGARRTRRRAPPRRAARRGARRASRSTTSRSRSRDAPPVDGEAAYPDVVSETPAPPAVLVDQLDDFEPAAPRPSAEPVRPAVDRARRLQLPGRGRPQALARRSRRASRRRRSSAPPRRSSRRSPTSASRRTVIGQVVGPRVTRYELQLAPGTKVGKVAALKDDLAYALATTEIRILAPIPGKQAVGVEVPNLSPNIVTLGDIYDDMPARREPALRLARQGHLRRRPSGPTSPGCRTS